MRIGIDARLWNETGIGRYIRNLVANLARIDTTNTYVVFLSPRGYDEFVPPNARWEKRKTSIHWHSISEQIILPFLFMRERLSLLHVPYFTIPIFYPGPFVVTIHDLTILHFETGRATTLAPWKYFLRRVGYRIALTVGVHRARAIIAVSKATKDDISGQFPWATKKTAVMYEGIGEDNTPRSPSGRIIPGKKTVLPHGRYILNVGNAYPHKNLERFVDAFARFVSEKEFSGYSLVFVGREDYFTRRLKEHVAKTDIGAHVVFWGEASESDLVSLYSHAALFVFPSLAEGFGLPALEALSSGCPVACSDIPVFHEILGPLAAYFDPYDIDSIAKGMKEGVQMTVPSGLHLTERFSWDVMARKTLDIYERCACV